MTGAPTLDDLMSAANNYKSGAQAATEKILSLTGMQADIANSEAATYTQQATDDSTVEAAKQAAALRTQNSRVEAANIFHTNLEDVTNDIKKYADIARTAQQEKDDAAEVIHQKQQVSFFDDPLGYIVNQFTLNDDIAKHNAANAKEASAQAYIEKINQETQSTIVTQNAITAPITAASAEAATRNAAVKATIDAKEAAEKGLAYNVQGIQAVMGAKKEDLNMAFQLNNAKHAEEQTKIALQHLALSKQEFAFRQKEYEDKQADKEETAALGQSVIDSINRGRATRGVDVLDDVSGKMVMAALKGKTKLSEAMNVDYESGERSKLTGANSIGATPARAAASLASLPYKITPAQEPIKNLLSNAAAEVQNARHTVMDAKHVDPALNGLAGSKDNEQITTAMNLHAQHILDAYGNNINPGDSSNPLNIGSLNVLAKASIEIQQLPVYQKVLKPLMDSGVDLSDPTKLKTIVGDAVAKGQLTHGEAVETALIFQIGVRNNQAARNFTGFGLNPPQSYNAIDPALANSFGSKKTMNYTSTEEWSRSLTKQQADALSDAMLVKALNKVMP